MNHYVAIVLVCVRVCFPVVSAGTYQQVRLLLLRHVCSFIKKNKKTKHPFYFIKTKDEKFKMKQELQPRFTFKERRDVPHVDAAGFHELSQGDFQEEDGDSAHEDDQQVGDEEDTCGDEEQASGSGVDHQPLVHFASP